MQAADPHERVLAVFDAFLRYAREAGGTNPGARAAPRGEGSGRTAVPTSANPSTADDDPTRPGFTLPPPGDGGARDDGFADVPTRESPMSDALASTLAPLRDDMNVWDEPTRERPDVVRELRERLPEEPAPARRRDPLRDGFPQATIIVDEDAMMTVPDLGQAAAPAMRVGGESRAEQFVGEMTVLIKYGHAEQVPRELDRWMRTYPDDLAAHVKLAEFWATRVDGSTGLDRLFNIASRALDRGELSVARRVLDHVRREAANDLRVVALQDRVGRR